MSKTILPAVDVKNIQNGIHLATVCHLLALTYNDKLTNQKLSAFQQSESKNKKKYTDTYTHTLLFYGIDFKW